MIIINNIAGRWVAIPMQLINDERLSYAAKGVYAKIAALPERVEITAKCVQGGLNKRTIAAFLLELRNAGWLTVTAERADGRKVYQLNTSVQSAPERVQKMHPSECKNCTRASAKNAPDYINNININNIYNREREEESALPLPTFYHYPFDKRLTIEQKRRLVIDEVDKYVKSGAIDGDEARRFVLYWTEPLMFVPNAMRMEDPDLKSWNLENRIRLWVERGRR